MSNPLVELPEERFQELLDYEALAAPAEGTQGTRTTASRARGDAVRAGAAAADPLGPALRASRPPGHRRARAPGGHRPSKACRKVFVTLYGSYETPLAGGALPFAQE